MLKKYINGKPANAHQTYMVALTLFAIHMLALLIVVAETHFTVVL